MTQGSAARRRLRLKSLAALMGGLLLLGAAWTVGTRTGALLAGEDPARYVATLDELPIPPAWGAGSTSTNHGFITPTRATRSFLVDADPEDAATVLKRAMVGAGFEIYTRVADADWCDPHPLDSTPVTCATKVIEDCRENGTGGPISCWVEAFRRIDADPQHLEHLYGSVSPRGSTVDYGPDASPRYVSDPDRAVVVITADMSYPRHFWSSPTPAVTSTESPR